MISYVFPPMAAVGGYRTIKFCKYLPENGWEPVVLTVRKGFNYAYDRSLLDELDPGLKIYRSGNWEPHVWWEKRSAGKQKKPPGLSEISTDAARKPEAAEPVLARAKKYLRQLLSFPDANNFWIPFGVATGLRAVRKENIDVIFSTSPPASAHVVGHVLSRLTGRRHVIDFRDLWTLNENYAAKNLHDSIARLDRAWEKKVIKNAAAIITATGSFTEEMRSSNEYKNPSLFHTITNGLDADDFRNIRYPEKKNEKFTILHLGSLYGNRRPDFFFDCLKAWLEARPEVKDRVIVSFIGNTPDYSSRLSEMELDNTVSFAHHIPHARVLNKLWEADLLLLLLGFSDKGHSVIPAKLFEYIATGRPILAFSPAGEAEKIIDRYDRGMTVSSPDRERVVKFLDGTFRKWKDAPGPAASGFLLPDAFNRKHLARKLSEILKSIKQKSVQPDKR
jgi:glycosyltransferase involved in cell wall biosynthesis